MTSPASSAPSSPGPCSGSSGCRRTTSAAPLGSTATTGSRRPACLRAQVWIGLTSYVNEESARKRSDRDRRRRAGCQRHRQRQRRRRWATGVACSSATPTGCSSPGGPDDRGRAGASGARAGGPCRRVARPGGRLRAHRAVTDKSPHASGRSHRRDRFRQVHGGGSARRARRGGGRRRQDRPRGGRTRHRGARRGRAAFGDDVISDGALDRARLAAEGVQRRGGPRHAQRHRPPADPHADRRADGRRPGGRDHRPRRAAAGRGPDRRRLPPGAGGRRAGGGRGSSGSSATAAWPRTTPAPASRPRPGEPPAARPPTCGSTTAAPRTRSWPWSTRCGPTGSSATSPTSGWAAAPSTAHRGWPTRTRRGPPRPHGSRPRIALAGGDLVAASTTSGPPRCAGCPPRTSSTSRSPSARSRTPTPRPTSWPPQASPALDDRPRQPEALRPGPRAVAEAVPRQRRPGTHRERPPPRRGHPGLAARAAAPRLAARQPDRGRGLPHTQKGAHGPLTDDDDTANYADAKEPWFDEAAVRAEEWAKATGWTP